VRPEYACLSYTRGAWSCLAITYFMVVDGVSAVMVLDVLDAIILATSVTDFCSLGIVWNKEIFFYFLCFFYKK
jgi:hypothetical protein